MPLISIVTPCLNAEPFIAQAVRSVLSQDCADVEHIVVDGGSTDGTLAVLKEYPGVKVISRPGSGLYEALNLGIEASRGKIVGQLNGDDLYAPGAIAAVMEAFSEPAVDSVCGGAEMFQDLPVGRRVVARLNGRSLKQLRLANIIRGIPIINARFFRRAVYQRVGFYDETYRIVSDRDFLLRVWCAGIREAQLDAVVYRYRMHEDSLTLSGGCSEEMLQENVRAAQTGRSRAGGDRCLVSAYRRWHAWAVGYRFGTDLTGGRYRAALRDAFEATARSPLWPLIFAGQAVNHWLTRSERRWSDESA